MICAGFVGETRLVENLRKTKISISRVSLWPNLTDKQRLDYLVKPFAILLSR